MFGLAGRIQVLGQAREVEAVAFRGRLCVSAAVQVQHYSSCIWVPYPMRLDRALAFAHIDLQRFGLHSLLFAEAEVALGCERGQISRLRDGDVQDYGAHHGKEDIAAERRRAVLAEWV